MLDLRRTFDQYRVRWRDHGANVSRNNIVISCPFCNKTPNPDHGEHLAISTIGEFYCYRNPAHKGRSLAKLFGILNIPYAGEKFKESPRSEKVENKDFSQVRFFQPAEKDEEALAYLESRNFNYPIEACKKFHLLSVNEGKWAGRLIIPLTIGWTGRAMRDHIEPRYLTESTSEGYFIFGSGQSAIIQEGPLDAMRLASVSNQFTYIAMTGKKLPPSLLLKLRDFTSIYFLPDDDVPVVEWLDYLRQIRSFAPYSEVGKLSLPVGVKDSAKMIESQAREWLYSVTS